MAEETLHRSFLFCFAEHLIWCFLQIKKLHTIASSFVWFWDGACLLFCQSSILRKEHSFWEPSILQRLRSTLQICNQDKKRSLEESLCEKEHCKLLEQEQQTICLFLALISSHVTFCASCTTGFNSHNITHLAGRREFRIYVQVQKNKQNWGRNAHITRIAMTISPVSSIKKQQLPKSKKLWAAATSTHILSQSESP